MDVNLSLHPLLLQENLVDLRLVGVFESSRSDLDLSDRKHSTEDIGGLVGSRWRDGDADWVLNSCGGEDCKGVRATTLEADIQRITHFLYIYLALVGLLSIFALLFSFFFKFIFDLFFLASTDRVG